MTDPAGPVDQPGSRPVLERTARFRGAKWEVVTDTVALDATTRVRRDVVVHPGAVGVLALDDHDRVLLVHQYRHPVQATLWELPAGLLDVPGEPSLDCARRELFEEAHLRARRWDVLLDVYSSPGMSSEAYRVYLARDLTVVPEAEQHVQQDEERDMPTRWVPLDEACAAVARGDLRNAMAVAGVLAARQARDAGWHPLRPLDAPWPAIGGGPAGD